MSWNAPTTQANGTAIGNLTGFRVYYGTASGVYSSNVYVPGATTSSATLSRLSSGTWYFTVTSVDASGNESSLGYEMSKSL